MNLQDALALASFVLGGVGMCFTAYYYITKPQIRADKDDALIQQSVSQLQKDLANLRDNHIHSLDLRLEENNKGLSALTIQVTRLSTVMEERMPKRVL